MQQHKLLQYVGHIYKWNKVYNLTSIREPEEMLSLHVLDSLFAAALIEQQIGRPDLVLDVGSGAGLPGVVLAILWPEVIIHCVDSVGKKAAFLNQVRAELSLPNLVSHHARVEELVITPWADARQPLITCRAYASLEDIVKTTQHFLASNQASSVAALKAKKSAIDEELSILSNHNPQLQSKTLAVPFPDSSLERHVVFLA